MNQVAILYLFIFHFHIGEKKKIVIFTAEYVTHSKYGQSNESEVKATWIFMLSRETFNVIFEPRSRVRYTSLMVEEDGARERQKKCISSWPNALTVTNI